MAADDVPRWPDLPPQEPSRRWRPRWPAIPPRQPSRELGQPYPPPHQPSRRLLNPASHLLNPTIRKAAVGAGLIGYSWFAASTVPFTRNALLIVLLPGAVLAVIAYARPPKRIPPPHRLNLTGFSYWAIAVTALFEWEASAFRDGAPWWHPALTTLIDPVLGPRPVKAAGILIWLLAGWALVRR
jgi:hypothetical protein